eukprot:3523760-Amphidinium_carterae.1
MECNREWQSTHEQCGIRIGGRSDFWQIFTATVIQPWKFLLNTRALLAGEIACTHGSCRACTGPYLIRGCASDQLTPNLDLGFPPSMQT